jgi:hypothetical protein
VSSFGAGARLRCGFESPAVRVRRRADACGAPGPARRVQPARSTWSSRRSAPLSRRETPLLSAPAERARMSNNVRLRCRREMRHSRKVPLARVTFVWANTFALHSTARARRPSSSRARTAHRAQHPSLASSLLAPAAALCRLRRRRRGVVGPRGRRARQAGCVLLPLPPRRVPPPRAAPCPQATAAGSARAPPSPLALPLLTRPPLPQLPSCPAAAPKPKPAPKAAPAAASWPAGSAPTCVRVRSDDRVTLRGCGRLQRVSERGGAPRRRQFVRGCNVRIGCRVDREAGLPANAAAGDCSSHCATLLKRGGGYSRAAPLIRRCAAH